MTKTRNEAAYRQVMREWVVPECLHVPIVAEDETAISDHIGEIVQVLSPGRALLVKVEPPPPRDDRLPIWQCENVEVLFDSLQVWVSPQYSRYRKAYIKAKGRQSAEGKVLAHVFNRRMAINRGFGFIRLVAVSRRANSSSAFTEQWGIALTAGDGGAKNRKLGLRMQYADLGHLMVMLDMNIGGGVQEAFRVAQDLIEVPGIRRAQASYQ